MRTDFSDSQLASPKIREANRILRSCVRCGMCTAHCPTYQLLGHEADGPRGRIYLIREMLQRTAPPTPEMVLHLDRCLSCLACSSICPSDVDYRHLLDQARNHIENEYRRPLFERILRGMLAYVLVRPRVFRRAMYAAKLLNFLKNFVPDARLRAMFDMVPKTLPQQPMPKPGWYHPQQQVVARVGLFIGCVQKVLAPRLYQRTIDLLNRFGVSVYVPETAHCCGAIVQHMGREAQARSLAAGTLRAMTGYTEWDAIIVNISGCGAALKDYRHLLPESADFATKVADITEFLLTLNPPDIVSKFPGKEMRIAYHAACTLQHGQKIVDAPKTLLRDAGFEVHLPQESHMCCGSAGTYNLLQPEISEKLKNLKIQHLNSLQPDYIAAGNIGCLMQIGCGINVPVVHTLELLDWAYGGARPQGIFDE